jgi:hypothetical protein
LQAAAVAAFLLDRAAAREEFFTKAMQYFLLEYQQQLQ